MNYVDVLIAAVLVYALVKGYFSGFFSSVASIAAYAVGLLVAVYYYNPFKGWLNQSYHVADRISDHLYPLLPIPQPVMGASVSSVSEEELLAVVNQLSLPGSYKDQMLSHFENSQLLGMEGQASVGTLITNVVANTIVEVMAFVILFMVVFSVAKRLGRFITRRISGTFFSPINRFGGAVIGLGAGALGLVLALGLIVPLVTAGQLAHINSLSSVGAGVEQSIFTPYLLDVFLTIQASLGGILPFAGEMTRI